MYLFRTILLWLAFLLLIVQLFWDYSGNLYLAMLFRLIPSAVLVLWFVFSIFFAQKESIKIDTLPLSKKRQIKLTRVVASFVIITGAVFKLMHWAGGNLLLVSGIGCMAIYSTLITIYGHITSNEQNDIIDDFSDGK